MILKNKIHCNVDRIIFVFELLVFELLKFFLKFRIFEIIRTPLILNFL